jgi:formylglycine-generating enzyme required for sulfatase activity/tRNA A-37 threonylcarbamoyl transferase component Bud32
VAGGVLNVVAPGSGALVELVEFACDKAIDSAQDQWEASLLEATQNNTAELQRLGQLFELLSGDLASLCDKAAAFADEPEDLPDILARALAANPALSRGLHSIEAIKIQCDAFQADLRRLARNQEEALPVYARMHRVCDYFDELWAAGIRPRDFAQQVQHRRVVADHITQGNTEDVDGLLLELRTAAPRAASLCVLEAAAATREQDYPAAQRALTRAVKLRPDDRELIDLSRRVTVLATQATPHQPPTTDPARPPRLQPGDTLDGWLLEARLGAGGWGQVFKVTRQGQTRALKVMHPEFAADADFVARFKKEVATLLRLPRHPNLVGIEAATAFGYCRQRDAWYLAMDFIEGVTLERYLAARGPLTEGQVRKVFGDAVAGLAEAHKAGIVHRDIKPGNLILRKSDQRLVFVDFGLAVGVEELGQTKVGGLSVLFAAPEQHYGEPATQASDVFSLCAVIHYALNYDKPELRKPNRFSPALIPESVRTAVTHGLKHNADERLRDAGQLLAAISSSEEHNLLMLASPAGDPMIGTVIRNRLGMSFAWVPPGDSWLGGGDGKPGSQKFTLKQGLWCGVYPVTQAEWQALMGNNPSHFQGNPRYPVEQVSWNDVREFLGKLNQNSGGDGLLYRLPTEEEWEYICRGGPVSQNQSSYHFYFARSKTDLTPAPTNDLASTQANFDGKYPVGSASKGPFLERPCDVGLYLPNPLGIYDLHGNVWEWTTSKQGSYAEIQGGSWNNGGDVCAAASRGGRIVEPGSHYLTSSYQGWRLPGSANGYLGFRLLAVPSGK